MCCLHDSRQALRRSFFCYQSSHKQAISVTLWKHACIPSPVRVIHPYQLPLIIQEPLRVEGPGVLPVLSLVVQREHIAPDLQKVPFGHDKHFDLWFTSGKNANAFCAEKNLRWLLPSIILCKVPTTTHMSPAYSSE